MDTKEHKPQQQHKIKQERNDGIVLLFYCLCSVSG